MNRDDVILKLRNIKMTSPCNIQNSEPPSTPAPEGAGTLPGPLFTCDWSPGACRFLFLSHQPCSSTGTQFHSLSKSFTPQTSQTAELSHKAGDPFPRTPRRRYPQVEASATAGTTGDSAPPTRHRSCPLVTSEAQPLGRFPRIVPDTNYVH